MDDIQVLSSDPEDLVTFDKVMLQFEAQSGAILSRDKKTKVMGLGRWRGRQNWPEEVKWIKSVNQMKVLGFIICPDYSSTLKCSWENVFRGFQKTIFSWESRLLFTLQERVTVVQTFALSKLWYTAQVLPLPPPMCKKIEALMSSFIFRGRHERLKLAEIQNPHSKGGLSLTCVSTKSECLLLRQSLRIIERPLQNCTKHLGNWLGSFLKEVFPHLYEQGPVCQVLLPQYPLHSAMLEVLEEGLTRNEYTPSKLAEVTTKAMYRGRVEDVLPPPKVEREFPDVEFQGLVYPRLSHAVLEPGPKDTLYCIIHGLYRNREQLFSQNRANNPYCPVPECQGAVQDREHIFCSCTRVVETWPWVRSRLLQLLPRTIALCEKRGLYFSNSIACQGEPLSEKCIF